MTKIITYEKLWLASR